MTNKFAANMRQVAVIIIVIGFVLGGPLFFASTFLQNQLLNKISDVISIGCFLYLSLIPLQFYRRTQLIEYLMYEHYFWLSGVLSFWIILFAVILLSLVNLLLRGSLQLGPWLGALWPLLAIAGRLFRGRRLIEYKIEITKNSGLWTNLSKMTKQEISILKFPNKPAD